MWRIGIFNQLTHAEIVGAIGVTARDAARGGGPASEFDRDQLMSAYSATRHLAVELSTYGPELQRFIEAVASHIHAGEACDPNGRFGEIATRLQSARDAASVGTAVCELLDRLCEDDSRQARALRSAVHTSLRELAEREVDMLADALR
jgi:hypothetical protein